MKHLLLTTIAAVLVVGCGPPDISIHQAVFDENIEAVKQHLAAGTDVNVKDSDFGNATPLHNAARWGYKEIIELLISSGADVNAKDDNGWTPLHRAANKEIRDLLRKHGAKTDEELKAAGK